MTMTKMGITGTFSRGLLPATVCPLDACLALYNGWVSSGIAIQLRGSDIQHFVTAQLERASKNLAFPIFIRRKIFIPSFRRNLELSKAMVRTNVVTDEILTPVVYVQRY